MAQGLKAFAAYVNGLNFIPGAHENPKLMSHTCNPNIPTECGDRICLRVHGPTNLKYEERQEERPCLNMVEEEN